MKNLKYLFFSCLVLALGLTACNNDDDGGPAELRVVTIEAKGTSFEDGSDVTADLNGAAAATDVALNSSITITFDAPVNAASVTSTNVALTSDAGTVATTLTTSGSTVTIDPDADLTRGTMYTLTVADVKGTNDETLAAITRTFTTEGRAPVVVPNESEMEAYWNFDGSTDDAKGGYVTENVVAIEFGTDRFGQLNSTATFDGNESIIEIANGDALMDSDDFTVSFWVKTNSDGHVNQDGNQASFFVFGLAAFEGFQFEIPGDWNFCKLAMSYELENGMKESEDLFFNGNGEDNMNGGWQGWDFVADLSSSGGVPALLQDKWAHVICTYDAAEKKGQMFINGELMKSQDFDLWPDGAPKRTVTGVAYDGVEPDLEPILAFGFIKSADSQLWADTPWGDYYKPTSNHFKGDLDDVRFFSAPFTADDARDLYNAEKP